MALGLRFFFFATAIFRLHDERRPSVSRKANTHHSHHPEQQQICGQSLRISTGTEQSSRLTRSPATQQDYTSTTFLPTACCSFSLCRTKAGVQGLGLRAPCRGLLKKNGILFRPRQQWQCIPLAWDSWTFGLELCTWDLGFRGIRFWIMIEVLMLGYQVAQGSG